MQRRNANAKAQCKREALRDIGKETFMRKRSSKNLPKNPQRRELKNSGGVAPFATNDPSVKRIGGYLYRIVPIINDAGKIIYFSIKPLMIEFRPRDIMQVVVGASLFAIPLAFTEEVWALGAQLPAQNVAGIAFVSVTFIAAFVFFNIFRFNLKKNVFNYFIRVIGTYALSALVVAAILTLIGKCPWGVDNAVAIKRIVLVAFPASMSGTLSDTIR